MRGAAVGVLSVRSGRRGPDPRTQARGEALADHQEAVIGQTLAENWPAVVQAAAAPLAAVEHMVLLNGATGMAEVLSQAVTQGAAGLGLVRSLLGGSTEPDAA